jgi:hypothetical protein
MSASRKLQFLRARSDIRVVVFSVVVAVLFGMLFLSFVMASVSSIADGGVSASGGRSLLQEASYNPVGSCDYGHAMYPSNAGGFIGLLLICSYMFLAAAIACDDYFVYDIAPKTIQFSSEDSDVSLRASLTKIASTMGLSEAVAGMMFARGQ